MISVRNEFVLYLRLMGSRDVERVLVREERNGLDNLSVRMRNDNQLLTY